MPEFIVKLGDQTLQTRRFDGELLRIGRSRDNDIVLENLSVSREHAQVRFHNSQYILTDLNSANGTLVNGVKVTKTEIVDEDVITIGKHKLYFKNPVTDDISTRVSITDAFSTVMVEPKAEAWVTINSGRLEGREFKITRFETSLGKAPTNDIVLTDDWLLGKKQAIILRKGNHAFEIHDLGGLRKVKVNGTPAGERADLKDGDQIEMGGTKLTFHAQSGPTPTGRIPKELPAEPVHSPGKLQLTPPRGHISSPPDESLDLEESFKSVRITMKNQEPAPAAGFATDKALPAVPAPREDPPEPAFNPAPLSDAAAESDLSEAEHFAAEDTPLPQPEQQPEPPAESPVFLSAAPDESPEPVSSPASQPAAAPKPQPARNNVFEDQRSTTRRKRKHHQRASQKEGSSSGAMQRASATAAVAEKTSPPPAAAPAAPKSPQPADEKEILMWEEALKNPSPAIKRQAAKMLKKLTGRDYDV